MPMWIPTQDNGTPMANADIKHPQELMAAATDPDGGGVPPTLEPTAIGLDLPSASDTG